MNRRATFLLPVMVLAGCATPLPHEPLIEQAEQAVREAERAGSAERRMEARRHLALVVHEQARKLEESGRPGDALKLLEALHERLPDQPLLKKDIERLRRLRDEALSRATLKRDLAEVQWLNARLRYDRLLQRWRKTDPIDRIGDRLRKSRLEMLLVSLRARAADAVSARDRKTAENILAVLEKLRGREYVEEERRAFQAAWLPRTRKPAKPAAGGERKRRGAQMARKSGPEHDQDDPDALRQALTRALQRGDLLKSRMLAQRIAHRRPHDPAVRDLLGAIDAAIQARIAHLDELAGLAYRDQNYQAAAALWEQILRIDPDNAEAKVRLERVQKVIANLEALQKQGAPATAPGAEPQRDAAQPSPQTGRANAVTESEKKQ